MEDIILKTCPFMKRSTILTTFVTTLSIEDDEDIEDIDMFIDA